MTITQLTTKLTLPTLIISALFIAASCDSDHNFNSVESTPEPITISDAVSTTFNGKIDFDNLTNYANQSIPNYITKDNTEGNPITNEAATLGRVLFYDKNLSVSGTVSCASCHQQSQAFTDNEVVSQGVDGTTGRHSMRLVNARFSNEDRFFWDERAVNLESQSTQPIRDHVEMGFSGTNGDPSFDDLLEKMSGIEYYPELFTFVYGDDVITEGRMQTALSQFIRSIQSFDSKYDNGRLQVANDNQPFPNFSIEENEGKQLFLNPPQFTNGIRTNGGVGCGGCHRAPEFDIDPNSGNNGVISMIGSSEVDLTNTKSPTLRDIFNTQGVLNSQLMHNGGFPNFESILDHYDNITPNPRIANRLAPNGIGQQLRLTTDEKQAITSFIKTLSGTNVYTDQKWSDPFTN